MSYKEQMREWLSRHRKATLAEAWEDGYFQALTNFCKKETFSDMATYEPKDGEYYYAPHRSSWGIWQHRDHGDGISVGYFVKDCPTREDAKREVYQLNGWFTNN